MSQWPNPTSAVPSQTLPNKATKPWVSIASSPVCSVICCVPRNSKGHDATAAVPNNCSPGTTRSPNRWEIQATSQQWGKLLSTFDCVVVLKDHPDYDMDFIRQHAKQVVDARHHGFDPGVGQDGQTTG